MSAPDPEAVPTPEALASGQRTLAAIVFTDTVGFSALMSKDEEHTLRLVARDLDQMKAVCGAFGGQVLKSTGDGLVMLFTSAVQAVACALEIQRDFQKQNLELPQAEQLQHRIGIHLGDVFQHGGDVMGDGVNIAARLQTEAVPGGICLSKTVYDVVHNRLPFYVNDLGARKLKNIGRVTAYQISPMEGRPVRYRVAWYRWRPILWGMAALAALALTLLIVFYLGMHRQWAIHHPGQAGAFTLFPVTSSTPVQPQSAPPAAASAAQPASQPTPPVAGVKEVSETEFQDASFRYMTRYDFDGMEAWIAQHDWPGKSGNTLAKACPQLNHLVTWAHGQLQQYSVEKPLKVVGKDKIFFYWPVSFGGVKQKIVAKEPTPGEEPKIVLLGADQIPPIAMVGIVRTLLKVDAEPADASTAQLARELQLFIETYHVVLPGWKTPDATVANPPAAKSP